MNNKLTNLYFSYFLCSKNTHVSTIERDRHVSEALTSGEVGCSLKNVEVDIRVPGIQEC